MCTAHPTTDAQVDIVAAAASQDQNMMPPVFCGPINNHKAVEQGKEALGPQLRSVVLAKGAPNNIPSQILTQILKLVGEESEKNAVFFTEEMIAMMKKGN